MNFHTFIKKVGALSRGVLPITVSIDKYVPLDLSSKNKQLTEAIYKTPQQFESFIEAYLKAHNSLVAYGGYRELRDLYKSSALFDDATPDEVRNIHLGIDFWCAENTPITTPLDGVVHSFKNNSAKGNYGPTIILEHLIEETSFYTLYGHLSIESINKLEVGTKFRAGNQIGTLGNIAVNGGYAPHLHFQVIKDIGSCYGDYPGVSSKKNLDSFLQNCPDPLVLLGI